MQLVSCEVVSAGCEQYVGTLANLLTAAVEKLATVHAPQLADGFAPVLNGHLESVGAISVRPHASIEAQKGEDLVCGVFCWLVGCAQVYRKRPKKSRVSTDARLQCG